MIKKLFLTLVIAVLSVSVTNAQMTAGQFFIGGSLGFTTKVTENNYNENSVTVIEAIPQIGYQLTNDWSIGLGLGITRFSYISSSNYEYGSKYEQILMLWAADLSVRYNLFQVERLSFLLEGSGELGGGTPKSKYDGITESGQSIFMIGANILPVLQYNLSKRFSIEAYFDFLKIGYLRQTSGDLSVTSFGIGVNATAYNTDNISIDNTALLVRLGLIFKF